MNDRVRTWELWSDLDLDVWVDKGKQGEKDIDNVRVFFSQVDIRIAGGEASED